METRRRNSNDVYLTLTLMKKMPINGVKQGKEKGGIYYNCGNYMQDSK